MENNFDKSAFVKGITDFIDKFFTNNTPVEKKEEVNENVPKFKVGDWVVDIRGRKAQVTYVSPDGYAFKLNDNTYFSGSFADDYRLWSKKDMKEGDIVSSNDGIAIIKGLVDNAYTDYCHVDTIGKLRLDGYIDINDSIYPATKEQQDFLFGVMENEGYKWDPVNKKLDNICKPKFHIGDWVMDRTFAGHEGYPGEPGQIADVDIVNDKVFYKVLSIEDGKYLQNGEQISEYYLDKWTIKDAKEGDVLRVTGLHSNCIFINKGLDNWEFDEPNGDRVVGTGYCCIDVSEDKIEFCTGGPDCIETKNIVPATSKQRNLLFQTMKEHNYRWDDDTKKLVYVAYHCWIDNKEFTTDGYYVDGMYGIVKPCKGMKPNLNHKGVFMTEKLAKSASAFARITQIMTNDSRFGHIITDKEWDLNIKKYCIKRFNSEIVYETEYNNYYLLAFHTEEQRNLFDKEYHDLVCDYLMVNDK